LVFFEADCWGSRHYKKYPVYDKSQDNRSQNNYKQQLVVVKFSQLPTPIFHRPDTFIELGSLRTHLEGWNVGTPEHWITDIPYRFGRAATL
jgi:hypothetical protein